MSVLMNFDPNPNLGGVNGFGRRPANANGNLVAIVNTKVSATTNTTTTVPSAIGNGRLATDKPWVLAILSYQAAATVFVAVGSTSAAPANTTGTFTAGVSFINPTALLVKGGDVLNFYPLADAYVSVEFYSVV
jgi:hypothetical protein